MALTLPEARRRLAAAVGFAARRMWRLPGVEDEDRVVLDLLVEALDRMGRLYRPAESRPAVQALAAAPPHIALLVGKIVPLAARPAVPAPCGPAEAAPVASEHRVAAPVTPAVAAARPRLRTPSPARPPSRVGVGAWLHPLEWRSMCAVSRRHRVIVDGFFEEDGKDLVLPAQSLGAAALEVAGKVLERLPPAPGHVGGQRQSLLMPSYLGLADGQLGTTAASLFCGGLDKVAAWSAAAAADVG